MITVRLDEAAEWVGRSVRTVRRWANDGEMEAAGTDRMGRAVYDWNDVLRVERRMRLRQDGRADGRVTRHRKAS